MKTVLDGNWWFLHKIVASDTRVEVILAEAIGTPETVIDGKGPRPATRLDVTAASRYFVAVFSDVQAWFSINEDYTSLEEYEQGDRGTIRVMTCSRFLDFVRAHYSTPFGWPEGLRHYRIWTCNDVVDVLSNSDLQIESWSPP